MRQTTGLLLVALIPAILFGATRTYDVDVYKNVNGWTSGPPNVNYVSQSFTCTADSLLWAEFFVGAANSSGQYRLEVQTLEQQGLYYGNVDCHVESSYRYIGANLTPSPGAPKLVKGKTYVLKITHSNGDAVNFYYDSTNSYKYGHLILPGQDQGYPEEYYPTDLCCRIEGINRPVSPDFFGVNGILAWRDSTTLEELLSLMNQAGIRWSREYICWRDMEDSNRICNWSECDRIFRIGARRGIQFLPCLTTAPAWASSYALPANEPIANPETLSKYAPLNLFEPVWDSSLGCFNPQNFWGCFVNEFVSRYSVNPYNIKTFEIWNEPNYMRPPNRGYDSFPDHGSVGFRERLYARLCDIACEAAHHADPGAKVIAGGLGGVFLKQPEILVPGKDWLAAYYAGRGPEHANAGVSVHPYQYGDNSQGANPDIFARDLDTIRALMNANGDEGKGLYATELAWSMSSREDARLRAALAIPECHLMSLAVDPVNFYDRVFWFELYNAGLESRTNTCGSALLFVDNLTDNYIHLLPCYSTYQQMTHELLGKRLIGRVLSGDAATDKSTFLYELESTTTGQKTWVGWRNFGTAHAPPVQVRIPARTDDLDTFCLARSPNPASGSRPAGTDGWLSVSLGADPVYIKENASEPISRPDLAVDSIWTDPAEPESGIPVRFWARVRNDGTANWILGRNPIALRFYANGTLVGMSDPVPSIAQGEWSLVSSRNTWTPSVQGDQLVSAVVNESRTIVELNWDNNASYRLYQIH